MERAASLGGDDLEDAASRPAPVAEDPHGTDAEHSAETATGAEGMRPGRPMWPVFAGLAVAVFILDQLSKAWIAANVDPGRPTEVVGEYLRLVISHNTGAIFGLFRDAAPLFALASLAVIGLIVAYHRRSGRNPVLSVALGLLLGGALGNLTDRLRLGYVLDFVDAGLGDVRWYTFNVADAAISVSLLLILLLALFPSLGPGREDRRTVLEPDA